MFSFAAIINDIYVFICCMDIYLFIPRWGRGVGGGGGLKITNQSDIGLLITIINH